MAKRLAILKKSNPEVAARADAQEIAEDADKYASLKAVADSEGGKALLKALNSDIAGAVNALVGSYKTAPEIELRALCAKLEAQIQVARILNRASLNLEGAEEALKELTG